MLRFGLLSSAFDVLTFVTLLAAFAASPATFRTAWFVESLLTELLVALVIRSARPAWRSRPGRLLLWSTLALVPLAVGIPYLPGIAVFRFVGLAPTLMAAILLITVAYLAAAEALKRRLLPLA
jgi:Mg2+-importing ATPase